MPQKKSDHTNIEVENITDVSGEVNIAGGDIYKGFTAEQVSVLIKQITSTFEPKKFDGRSPYKGLDVFEEEDAKLFFGRERIVADLVDRVKESRTVFITGPSGSGKSSLVRAGLMPALKQGNMPNSDHWLYATLKPGRDPFQALASALSRLKSPELGDYFLKHRSNSEVLHTCAETALSERSDQRLVLFIDQFEEVFTQIKDEAERVAFLKIATHAAMVENGRAILLFSMRSDFVSNCATYAELNALINQQFVQIGAMQPDELVSAIAQPALRVGLKIEPDLIAQIIKDMQGEPGALPLMQFALKDLFDAGQAQGGIIALTLNGYLERGGIRKALERHADNAFNKLDKHEQELARVIFSGLIEIGHGTQDTRRTANFDELIPASANADEVGAIVRKLADARLITTDEIAGKDMVTISHEKLIEAWPWLKKLVDENRDVIALQNQIAEDAQEWDEHKRDASYLYSGARLINASEKMKSKELVLSGRAYEFVQAGFARKKRQQLARMGGIAGFIGLIIAGVIFFSYLSTTNAKKLAEQQGYAVNTQVMIANTAQTASTLAIAQKATAQANADEAKKQQTIALARQLASQAQSIDTTRNSKQMVADLLALQSLKLFPNTDASAVLINNDFSAPVIAHVTHDSLVYSVAFSPDGRYVVSGSYDNTARVWEATTGKEIARMTHDGWVTSVAFSPDGRYVVSGSWDNTARVWEVASGHEIARMNHDGRVTSVAFSPDGRYVVSGSYDNTARVWDAATGKEIARMTHDDGVLSVAFSPDSRYVVSCSYDGTARVWEATTGKEIARMDHNVQVNSVAFSPDGRYVVSGSVDNTARVWETTTGKEITRMTHGDAVDSVAFSPDGRYVVCGSDDRTARVWEATTGKEIARMTHDDTVFSVAFSPDGEYVVSGSWDGTARVWEAATGVEIARMTHDSEVNSVAFSPDGRYVVSGSDDNTARVWEAANRQAFTRMTHDAPVWPVAFSPDSSYVVSGSDDNTARVWEAMTGKEIAHMTHDSYVYSVAFSPDGRYVVSGSQDGTARVWEAATGKEIARITHDSYVISVAFSPDGRYVVSGSDDKTARVWEAATGKEIARMTHDSTVTSVAFSPDGRYVVSGSQDGTARVWEAATGKEIARMIHDSTVTSVAFSPDGRYVVSGSDDRTARVWEAATGKEIARMTHNDWVESVAFSPDGKYVVSGSGDNTARVWEVATGKEIARITHDGQVISVAFSPDSRYVVSGSNDGTVRVWVAASGQEVARMTHGDNVHAVAFSPDGRYVVSGSADHTVRVWMWQPKDLAANACYRLDRNLTSAEWKQYIGDALPYQAVCNNLPIEPLTTVAP